MAAAVAAGKLPAGHFLSDSSSSPARCVHSLDCRGQCEYDQTNGAETVVSPPVNIKISTHTKTVEEEKREAETAMSTRWSRRK